MDRDLLLWFLTVVCALNCADCAGYWKRSCHFNNDPHFRSFDGQKFDYHGLCEHTLSRPCMNSNLPACLQTFEVFATNEKCSYHDPNGWKPTCVNEIGLRFRDPINAGNEWLQIKLTKQWPSAPSVQITNNVGSSYLMTGSFQFLPLPGGCGIIFIFRSLTAAHILISIQGYGMMHVYLLNNNPEAGIDMDNALSSLTTSKLCGICGQHKFNTGLDDFVIDNGQQFTPYLIGSFYHLPQAFYNYYTYFSKPESCDPRGQISVSGSRKKRQTSIMPRDCNINAAAKFCDKALSYSGFAKCLDLLSESDRNILRAECNFDYCSSPNDACATIAAFVHECADKGLDVGDWRGAIGCSLKCPKSTSYVAKVNPLCTKDSCGNLESSLSLLKARPSPLTVQQSLCLTGAPALLDEEGCECPAGRHLNIDTGRCQPVNLLRCRLPVRTPISLTRVREILAPKSLT